MLARYLVRRRDGGHVFLRFFRAALRGLLSRRHALLLGWSGEGISRDERLWNLLHNLYLLLARRDEALLKLGLDRGGNILIIRKLILLLS